MSNRTSGVCMSSHAATTTLPAVLPLHFSNEVINLISNEVRNLQWLSQAIVGGHFYMKPHHSCQVSLWALLLAWAQARTVAVQTDFMTYRHSKAHKHLCAACNLWFHDASMYQCYHAQKFSVVLLNMGNYFLKAIIKLQVSANV